jgi:hypothetical protein
MSVVKRLGKPDAVPVVEEHVHHVLLDVGSPARRQRLGRSSVPWGLGFTGVVSTAWA